MNIDMSKEIKSIDSREKMIRYFDGYAAERMEELGKKSTKRPLVKSYMLEHVGDSQKQKDISMVLGMSGIITEKIDENLYRVLDTNNGNGYMGFVEVFTPRYFVFYTSQPSDIADSWVKNLVFNSPDLDHIWLSGLTFNVLWKRVIQLSKPYRYVSLLFVHESIYEIDSKANEPEHNENEYNEDQSALIDRDVAEIIERRAAKFKLVDKISVVQEKLDKLQELYSPLYAISQLRFPSPIGRGGHDFYDNGKVTNRSGDFRDHRSHILYVQRIYDELMKRTEERAWYSLDKEKVSVPGKFQKLIGAPVTIDFGEPLSKETFDYWIKSTFGRINNKFRLWGNPIVLGPTKVHVYGVDKHLWKPIFLELTNKHLIAIVPKGTCGNTIHRLICNIQKYIDPSAKAYIGDKEYKSLVDESSKEIKYGTGY
ncbi:MAG TPA: hypothetical protein PLL62_00355 [Candidatus Saccharicenans sp.]|nr:hypothetical protein [Candidatus Saccharicenans sp.]HQM73674.1 hypothetical protein [Candidatus Saccharicenans sp.]